MAFGGSALLFAATHRELGRPPSGQHVAVDPFQSVVWDDTGRLALEKERVAGYVEVLQQRSYTALPALLAAGRTFDMAYIDGSHLFEDVFGRLLCHAAPDNRRSDGLRRQPGPPRRQGSWLPGREPAAPSAAR